MDPADVLAELLAAGYQLFKYERIKDERSEIPQHVWVMPIPATQHKRP